MRVRSMRRERPAGGSPPAGLFCVMGAFSRRGRAPPRASHAEKGRGGISSAAALPCVLRGGCGLAGFVARGNVLKDRHRVCRGASPADLFCV